MLFRKKSGSAPPEAPAANSSQAATQTAPPAAETLVSAPSASTAAEPTAPTDGTNETLAPREPQAGQFTSAHLAALRARSAAIGEVISILMRSPGHRNRTLADIEHAVGPALVTGQFTVARRLVDNNIQPVGIIMWASVSPALDQQMAANLDKPFRLKPEDWRSGADVWLIEAAGDPRVVSALINDACAKLNAPIKIRTKDKDGNVGIKVVQPGQANTAAS